MAIVWHKAQGMISSELADWLSSTLPICLGNNYWKSYVINAISVSEQYTYQSIEEGDFEKFDLAALIKIAIANSNELATNGFIGDNVEPNLRLIKSARNKFAHEPVTGIPAKEELKLLEPWLHLLEDLDRDCAVQLAFDDLLEPLREQVRQEKKTPSRPTEKLSKGNSKKRLASHKNQKPNAVTIFRADPNLPKKMKSFIGLDFGTSTSVVSIINVGPDDKLSISPISLDQPEENGGKTRHHLINTVLALSDGKILFGRDAHRLRPFLISGVDVFSSFKMLLGLDIGPDYPMTSLPRGTAEEPVETAKDATTLFFKKLKSALTEALTREARPTEWAIAVTVPASFEANQRRDLSDCLKQAGLTCVHFIDEPNAAFLNHLFETSLKGEGLGHDIKENPYTICVYDIGAGTCDVSILDIHEENNFPVSKNRAISRFTALGGDDIDRLIAKNVLWPQLKEEFPEFDPAESDIEHRIIPRLMPTAESLKISATNILRDKNAQTLNECNDDTSIAERAIKEFSERDRNGDMHILRLDTPRMSLTEFGHAIAPILSAKADTKDGKHVYAPVANALSKAELKPSDIDAVLFIGGTALNPLIRNAIMSRFSKARAIVPRDLQTHVSMGAAIHAYAVDQRGIDMIAPITPEAIYVIARGGELEPLIRAGTVVPMDEIATRYLKINRDGQSLVELPICVGSEDKILGILQIEADRTNGFPKGSDVMVSAHVNREKILEVTAKVDGRSVRCELIQPLSNEEKTPQDHGFLKARQAFNLALLKESGRPPPEVVHVYALSALDVREYALAADLFQKLERLAKSDHAINISYAYARAGMKKLSKEWKVVALKRNPDDPIALYNHSLDIGDEEAIPILRRSINLDPNHRLAQIRLANILIERGEEEGKSIITNVLKDMVEDLDAHQLDANGCLNLAKVASDLGETFLARRAEARATTLSGGKRPSIDNKNLADSVQPIAQLEKI